MMFRCTLVRKRSYGLVNACLSISLLIAGVESRAQTAPPAPEKPGKTASPSQPITPSGGGTLPKALAPTTTGPLAPLPPPKLSAEEWNKKGGEAMKARKFDEAIVDFKLAAQAKPSFSPAYYGLGMAYEAGNQPAEAARAFQTLCRLNPDNPQFFALLSGALSESNQTQAAVNALDRAIELSPATTSLQAQRGALYMQLKDYKQAQTAYLQALGTAPDDPLVHVGLGDAYEQDGRHAAALAEYDAALLADANSLAARLGRATSLASVKRDKEAEAVITRTLTELQVTDTQLRARLASASGNTQAQAQLQVLIGQVPAQQAMVHATYAQILDGAQKREQAIQEYQASLKIVPDNATTWGNLGWTQYEAGQYEAAIQSSRKALGLDASLAYVRLNLGLIYAVQSKWAESQKEYHDALAVASTSDLTAGINDVREALNKQPNSKVLKQALSYLAFAANKS